MKLLGRQIELEIQFGKSQNEGLQ